MTSIASTKFIEELDSALRSIEAKPKDMAVAWDEASGIAIGFAGGEFVALIDMTLRDPGAWLQSRECDCAFGLGFDNQGIAELELDHVLEQLNREAAQAAAEGVAS